MYTKIINVNSSIMKLNDNGNDILIKKDANTNNLNRYDKKYNESIKRVYDLYIM